MQQPSPKQEQEQRVGQMKVELVKRFESICSGMSSKEFADLVDEMARIRLKYEELEAEVAKRTSS